MNIDVPRILIAATQSGAGKTTIVSGLLAALRARGLKVCGYKVGPDYIDPGYHRLAGGEPVYNLDTWLTDEQTLLNLFARTSQGADVAVVEGVMGLYDGGAGGVSSSAQIARLLGLPVALVLDAKSMGESAAAVALGFRDYDRRTDLRGVILNRLGSDSHRELVSSALERIGIPVLGALHRDEMLAVRERQMGLLPAEENGDRETVSRMRAAVERGLDLEVLLEAARSAPRLSVPSLPAPARRAARLRVGVARDPAFSFYYPESLSALEERGAELVFFSPLRDSAVPEVDRLVFGGGFPEVFAGELAANLGMKASIRAAAASGVLILAECGGFMYLTKTLRTLEGSVFEMVGLIEAHSAMNARLQTVGYVEAEALKDTVLCPAGTVLQGHEFRFSTVEPEAPERFPWAFQITRKRTGATSLGGCAAPGLLASYLHLNLLGNPACADWFLGIASDASDV
ncbi:MAG: cobyrinate a,c-diamide synthase [Fretibacterium sp.]|nr:cobyrinate a,c-diamide synthase [Fretibacterium sp.]